ncbi:hypothetical protein RRG08_024952 [Elysia crispata]|uniref:Plethodontid modulating factor n=1 Tax=Elysia crispata TaxID=231223 RepID=A0AAE0Z3C3_9GAST|nr:hypothetical protein RRG08_024952 [Elysia crispata]
MKLIFVAALCAALFIATFAEDCRIDEGDNCNDNDWFEDHAFGNGEVKTFCCEVGVEFNFNDADSTCTCG